MAGEGSPSQVGHPRQVSNGQRNQSELPEGLSVRAELAHREDKLKSIAAAKTGKKPRGKPPTPPSATPRAQD